MINLLNLYNSSHTGLWELSQQNRHMWNLCSAALFSARRDQREAGSLLPLETEAFIKESHLHSGSVGVRTSKKKKTKTKISHWVQSCCMDINVCNN